MTPSTTGPVVACRLWEDRRAAVDPLSGEVRRDPRTSGASPADDAALEIALQLAEAWGTHVVAVTVGAAKSDVVLRDALAAGARRAVRVAADISQLDAGAAAASIAGVARDIDASTVLCGDMGTAYGSGAVPALVAASLGARQALGLVELSGEPGRPGVVTGWRRLDGGRRQQLRVAPPAVVSVEGGVARLRRAALSNVLDAGTAAIEVWPTVAGSHAPVPSWTAASSGPGRPRTHVVDGPDPELPVRRRVELLTGVTTERAARRVLRAEPAEAAHELVAALADWGEWG